MFAVSVEPNFLANQVFVHNRKWVHDRQGCSKGDSCWHHEKLAHKCVNWDVIAKNEGNWELHFPEWNPVHKADIVNFKMIVVLWVFEAIKLFQFFLSWLVNWCIVLFICDTFLRQNFSKTLNELSFLLLLLFLCYHFLFHFIESFSLEFFCCALALWRLIT